MKKKIYIPIVSFLMLNFLPILTLANTTKITDFKSLVSRAITVVIRPIVPFLIGLAVVVFIYGVLTTMLSEGGEKKEDGKKYMLWGIVGIFVMVSVWGLVAILTGTFNLKNELPSVKIELPQISFVENSRFL